MSKSDGKKSDAKSAAQAKLYKRLGKSVTLATPNFLAEQKEQLRQLLPHVFTEGKIDLEKLRTALGDDADVRPERYSFTWACRLVERMKKDIKKCSHAFVDDEPADLVFGVIYVSITKLRIWHTCLCGCGGRVVLPINHYGWEIRFDGAVLGLKPSIRNDHLKCQSRYRITPLVCWLTGEERSDLELELAGSRAMEAFIRTHSQNTNTQPMKPSYIDKALEKPRREALEKARAEAPARSTV